MTISRAELLEWAKEMQRIQQETFENQTHDKGISRHLGMHAALIAELSKPDTADGWLPIESAPKDGQQILLWSPEKDPRYGRWVCARWAFGRWRTDEDQMYGSATVSHWQPLPKPPEAQDALS